MDRTIPTQTMWLTKFRNVQFLIGVLLLFCALTFYYFAVLRIDYSKTMLLDLGPYPDATEYFAQAKALRRDGWPSIQIGYEKLPSRYPPGYPVLMLPWLKVLRSADAVLAPFRTNQTLGLLLLLAVFAFYAYLAMPLTGGFAALLLATLPGFFTFCRSSMSDISASVLIAAAFMFTYLGVKEERRWKLYLSAVLLGLSINIRIQSLFFAPLLLAMALLPVRGMRLRWFLRCAAVPIAFLLAASPVLVLNTIQFHSPFKTGYDFWTPIFGEKHIFFSLRYIPSNAVALWNEFALGPLGYHTANIFGTGTSFVPAFLLLICAGLFFIRIDRFVICASLASFAFLTAILTHHYRLVDARYYLPLLIVSIAVAVLPVTWAAKNLYTGRRIVTALAIFVLFAAACLGYPSRSGYNTNAINRSQAWDILHFSDVPGRSTQFAAQRQFTGLLKRQPGIVLSDIDPVYLNALLPRSFIAAPVDGNHNYRYSHIWRYDRPQASALVERGLQQSLPVYALFRSQDEVATNQSRLPNVPGYDWRILNDSHANAAILKLIAIGSDDTTVAPK
jgi:4-amino-4-deoxy-L-arabinose transferase-like glycosyltransferase